MMKNEINNYHLSLKYYLNFDQYACAFHMKDQALTFLEQNDSPEWNLWINKNQGSCWHKVRFLGWDVFNGEVRAIESFNKLCCVCLSRS